MRTLKIFSDDIMRFRIVKIEHDETATGENFMKRIFPLVELFNRTGRVLRFTGDWNPTLIEYIHLRKWQDMKRKQREKVLFQDCIILRRKLNDKKAKNYF